MFHMNSHARNGLAAYFVCAFILEHARLTQIHDQRAHHRGHCQWPVNPSTCQRTHHGHLPRAAANVFVLDAKVMHSWRINSYEIL